MPGWAHDALQVPAEASLPEAGLPQAPRGSQALRNALRRSSYFPSIEVTLVPPGISDLSFLPRETPCSTGQSLCLSHPRILAEEQVPSQDLLVG